MKVALSAAAALGALGLGAVSALLACATTPADDGLASGEAGVTQEAGGPVDGSGADGAPSPESGLDELLFRPNKVYSGTDGTHAFAIPIAVYDAADDLTVVADGDGLSLAKASLTQPTKGGITDTGKYFMITVKKAGTYALTATSKGRSTTASVTVTAYDPSRYAVGQARYEAAGTGADRPCTTCHVDGAAIDQSPSALATATDQEITIIITTGVKPGPSVITIPSEPTTPHKWNVTDAQLDGLVTYLRGLPPRGFQ